MLYASGLAASHAAMTHFPAARQIAFAYDGGYHGEWVLYVYILTDVLLL